MTLSMEELEANYTNGLITCTELSNGLKALNAIALEGSIEEECICGTCNK